jgi:hypothetical protein
MMPAHHVVTCCRAARLISNFACRRRLPRMDFAREKIRSSGQQAARSAVCAEVRHAVCADAKRRWSVPAVAPAPTEQRLQRCRCPPVSRRAIFRVVAAQPYSAPSARRQRQTTLRRAMHVLRRCVVFHAVRRDASAKEKERKNAAQIS